MVNTQLKILRVFGPTGAEVSSVLRGIRDDGCPGLRLLERDGEFAICVQVSAPNRAMAEQYCDKWAARLRAKFGDDVFAEGETSLAQATLDALLEKRKLLVAVDEPTGRLPIQIPKDMETVEELVSARRRIRRGEALYRAGDYFNNLYVVRLGFLKSTVMSSDGREQVTNFFMAGEMIGLDGISSNVYSCDVVALEDTEVCVLPFDRVEQATTTIQTMGKHFQKLLSREIVRQHGVMLLLGSMHAEERLAAFLLSLSQRFENRGYSRSEFVLRMTRAEIGSYLGLKLETVSRVLSRFSHDGLIEVNQKHVRIFDPEGLRAIVSAVDLDHSPSPMKIQKA